CTAILIPLPSQSPRFTLTLIAVSAYEANSAAHSLTFSLIESDVQNLHTPDGFCNGHPPVSVLPSLQNVAAGSAHSPEKHMKGAYESPCFHSISLSPALEHTRSETDHSISDV